MRINNQVVVALKYTLRLDNKIGDVIEIVQNENPLVFLYQSDAMLDYFEEQIKDKEAKDNLNLLLLKKMHMAI